jgi:hypothetical protein
LPADPIHKDGPAGVVDYEARHLFTRFDHQVLV